MRVIEINNILHSSSLRMRLNESITNKDLSSEHLLNKFKNLFAYQVVFDGAKTERSKYDQVLSQCHKVLYDLLVGTRAYLVVIDDSKKTINKIRSYKGILNKGHLTEDEFVQAEFKFEEGKSLIGFIQRLSGSNFYNNIKFLGDQRRAFIITSGLNLISEDFLYQITNKYLLKFSDLTMIDYPELITTFCSQGNEIYRIGGDWGDNLLTIDIFITRSNKNKLSEKINHVLSLQAF